MTRALAVAMIVGMAGCGSSDSRPAARAPSSAEQRAKAGVFIVTTKQISEHEEIATVVIPSSIGTLLDQHCYIYRHKELKIASFQCPADRPIDLDVER